MVQLEKLVVSLEARINQYEKALAKAQGTTTREFKRIEQASERLDGRLARMGRGAFGEIARGALMAAAPIISFSAAVEAAKAAMAEFGDIADNAKAAGLDVEFFQGIAHGAQLAGVEFEAFSGSLATFAKNSGLAAEGKGRMVTALKALNPELLANIQAARTQEERLRLAAEAIRETEGASQRAALATALFGDAGFKLADAFSGGSEGIDAMVRSARQLGIVVDRDLIARAEQLGDEFDTATKVLDLQFKQVLVDLIPLLTGTAQAVIGLVNAVKDLWGAIANSPAMQSIADVTAPLEERSLAIMTEQLSRRRQALADAKASPGTAGWGGTSFGAAEGIADLERQIAELEQAIAARSDPTQFNVGSSFERLSDTKTYGSVADMWTALSGGGGGGGGTGGGGGGGGSSRNEAADAAVRQAEAVRNLVADLQFEQEQLGRTAAEQELYNALKSAGVTLESDYGQEIADAMGALQAQRTVIEGNAEAMDLLASSSERALQTIVDGFLDGKDAGEIFGALLLDIGSQLASMGISGLTNSISPGLPRRELGGPVRKGRPYIVGERRAELFVPDQNGRIIPQLPDASGARGGPAMSFPFSPVITVQDGSADSLARVERVVAKQAAEHEARTKDIVRSYGRKWK